MDQKSPGLATPSCQKVILKQKNHDQLTVRGGGNIRVFFMTPLNYFPIPASFEVCF